MAVEAVKEAPPATPQTIIATPPSPTPVAGPSVMRKRHRRIIWSFALCVVLPFSICSAYLWGFARNQYISELSFSVRTENMQSALDMLGGFSSIAGNTSNDVDILKQFIESQDLVRYMEQEQKISEAFSLGWPVDFFFAYNPNSTLEDLHSYWRRNVRTSTDNGLFTLSVRSYEPERSQEIALAIYKASKTLINQLSQEAREDATRFTREDLHRAEDRLRAAREEMTQFRLRSRIIDPMASLQAEIGILTSLQTQLSEALVQKELLSQTSREQDPRITENSRKIDALRAQINIEQQKFAQVGERAGGNDYATLFSQYERLAAELEFAEQTYRAATVAHDVALSEAKLNSRYLAMHVQPSIAEKSLFPDRPVQLAVAGFFLVLAWSVGLLIYYSIRDRR